MYEGTVENYKRNLYGLVSWSTKMRSRGLNFWFVLTLCYGVRPTLYQLNFLVIVIFSWFYYICDKNYIMFYTSKAIKRWSKVWVCESGRGDRYNGYGKKIG